MPALLLAWAMAVAPLAAPAAAADPFVIFKPLAPPTGLDEDRAQAIRDRWATALGPAHADYAKSYAEYEINPNPATALAALKHFKAMAKNDVLRNRAFTAHRDMFLTLDALKFELVLQTTRRINEVRRRIGKPMIAVSYRVGSSGKRFRQWLDWAAAGKDLAHMPIDEAYLLSKLSQSDDDISNTASPEDIAKDPLINERINGPRAAGVLAQVSAEMSGGAVTVTADDLKVEFLSPTKAYPHLMVRKAGEWKPELERWPSYLPAWIVGEREKYRGKFAEEQLHAWGMKAGHATDMTKLGDTIDARSVTAATGDYKDSPMAAMFESRLFPQGVTDPAGWMANNYRQIFIVHKGNVNDLAKYTLRMMEWWDNVGIKSAQDLRDNGIAVSDAQFASLRALADGIRNPDSEAALSALIGTEAKKNAALADLKKINADLLRAGHRRHAGNLAEHLTALMRTYGEGRPVSPGEQPRPPPSIDDLLARNPDFRNSMETLSTAYSNLPEELVAQLNLDLADYIKANETNEDPKVVFDVEVRLLLMKSLERAEAAGARLRRQGAAFESISKLVGELREEVNQHLDVVAKGNDLDGFIDNLIAGETTRWRLHLDWEEGSRVPRVRWLEAQWDPVDVDTDLRRMKGFAQHFGWEHEAYAETLYDYFHGDGSGTWTGLAINALRDLADMYDPARMKERVVRIKDQDGETKVFVVKPTGGDAAVNLGVTAFKAALKGGQDFQRVWKIWGDIDDGIKLGQSLINIFGPKGGQTTEQRAKEHALALSKTIALAEYAQYISGAAQQPWLFERFGGTIATAASLLGGPMDRDATKALSIAAMKDLFLWVQPELAYVFLVYDVLSWGSVKVSKYWHQSNMVALLIENGEWDMDGADGVPLLKGLPTPTGFLAWPDEEARKAACRAGASPGLFQLAKNPPESWKDGLTLKKSGGTVQPRASLLKLYETSDYDTTDQVAGIALKAVKAVPMTDVRAKTIDWTTKWLEDLGIAVPTPDDATQLHAGPINVEMKRTIVTFPGNPGEVGLTQDIHQLTGLAVGARSTFGYMVQIYWNRRQHLLECQILDQVVAEAVKQKQDEEIATLDLADVESELAGLTRRMKDLDRKVWAQVARSADPFDGPDYDPEKNVPLAEDYLSYTQYLRQFVETAIAYSKDPEQVKNPIVAWYFPSPGYARPGAPLEDYDRHLLDKVRAVMKELLGYVREYEDNYGAVLKALEEGDKYVSTLAGAGAGFTLPKYHIRLKPTVEREDWTLPRPFEGQANLPDPRLAGAQNLRLFTQGEHDKKMAEEKWLEAYKTQYDKGREDLGPILEAYFERLRPLAEEYGLQRAIDAAAQSYHTLVEWWHWWMASGPYKKAVQHPYWKDLLRLRFQVVKLDNMIPGAGEMAEEEMRAALTQMYLKEPGDLNVEGSGGGFLGGVKKQMEERYQNLLKLATGMIEVALDQRPSSTLKVTDKFRFDIDLRPRTALDGPSADEFTKLVRKYQWEMVPIDEAGSPDKDPDCQTYPVEEPFWFTEHVTQLPAKPKLTWLKRATHAGKYRLRVTALGDNDVPLARSSLRDILVEPATLAGTLEASGDWKPGADPVSVFLGSKGADKGHPRFRLTSQGDFEKPLCHFNAGDMSRNVSFAGPVPDDVGPDPPGSFPPNPFDAFAGVEKQRAASPNAPGVMVTDLNPRGPPVAVTFEAGGRFKLAEALKIHFPRIVTIRTPVIDAAGVEVAGAEISVSAGGETLTGPGPFQVELDKGDRVTGTVTYRRGEISLERRTRAITYDPATMGNEIELKTGLPLFDTGNLRVTGQFVPKADADNPAPPIAGGRLKTNVHAEPVQVGGGGIFAFSNDAPVLLSTTLTLAAVLRGGDDRLMKPVVSPYSHRLRVGPGVRDLGSIDAEPFTVDVSFQVRVTDWAGKRVPGSDVKATVGPDDDRRSLVRAGDLFEGGWPFSKWNERVPLRAEMALDTGPPAEGRGTISADDFGDLLDPKRPEHPFEVRLAVYMPGSLRVTGRVEATPPPGRTRPASVDLTVTEGDPRLTNDWTQPEGSDFVLDMGNPVRVGDTVKVEVKAQADGIDYKGRGSARAPRQLTDGLGIARLGVIRIGTTTSLVMVPSFLGMDLGGARGLVGSRLNVVQGGLVKTPTRESEANTIYSQSPESRPGTPLMLPFGSTVTVGVFGPWDKLVVPQMKGKKVRVATGLLQGKFKVGHNRLGPAPRGQDPFTVTAVTPAEGSEQDKGTTVTLSYYENPKVPGVTKKPLATAEGLVADAGFTPRPVSKGPAPEGQKPDVVVAQSPGAGTPKDPGSPVYLDYYEKPGGDGGGPGETDGTGPWAGPWTGTLKLDYIAFGGRKLTSYNALASYLKSQMKVVNPPPEEEEEKTTLGTIIAESFGAIGAAIGNGIFIAIQVGAEMFYDGQPMGFALERDAENRYWLYVPGMTPEQRAKMRDQSKKGLKLFMMPVEGDPLMLEQVIDQQTGDASKRGKARLRFKVREDFGEGVLSLVGKGHGSPTDDPRKSTTIELRLSMTVRPGPFDMNAAMKRVGAEAKRRMPRLEVMWKPYLKDFRTTAERKADKERRKREREAERQRRQRSNQ